MTLQELEAALHDCRNESFTLRLKAAVLSRHLETALTALQGFGFDTGPIKATIAAFNAAKAQRRAR